VSKKYSCENIFPWKARLPISFPMMKCSAKFRAFTDGLYRIPINNVSAQRSLKIENVVAFLVEPIPGLRQELCAGDDYLKRSLSSLRSSKCFIDADEYKLE